MKVITDNSPGGDTPGEWALHSGSTWRDDTKPTNKHLEQMYQLMLDEDGVGLAAPQIGIRRRYFVMHEEVNPTRFVLNPVILNLGGSDWGIESCLSYPGRRFMVQRADFVEFIENVPGRSQIKRILNGFAARVFLHEYDHLDGITLTDYREI